MLLLLLHLPAVALRPAAALGLVAVAVAAVPGGGRHSSARHRRQLQGPLRRAGLRLRRAVLRRRVLLLRRPRRRPQPAHGCGRQMVAAADVRRRAPRVQPVFLQQ